MLAGHLAVHLHKVGKALVVVGRAVWENAEAVGKMIATVASALGGLAVIISTAVGKLIIDSMESIPEEPALCS